MSLKPKKLEEIPTETAKIAKAAFGKTNLYIRMRDEIGTIFEDKEFEELYSNNGQPAQSPWRLALITIMQYIEALSDRQAANAVRGRIDWKYALGLELTDSGFDSTVLSEFRSRLIKGGSEKLVLDKLLDICREKKLLGVEIQRTDSTKVIAAVRGLTRLESVIEAMRYALNTLAVVAPDWLLKHSEIEWLKRYEIRAEEYNLAKSEEKRKEYACVVGKDGHKLLDSIYNVNAPKWLREIPAVETLRQIWVQQYYLSSTALIFRAEEQGTPTSSIMINSPYDTDATYAKQGSSSWVGYKIHITESCVENCPNLITNVETTPATAFDGTMTPIIHHNLQQKELLPKLHLADNGYVDADLLVKSQLDYSVTLLGPTRPDYKWQAQAGKGFDADSFLIDWDKKLAICPTGKESTSWTPALSNGGKQVIKIKFSAKDCPLCPMLNDCTQSKPPRRTLTIRPQLQYIQLHANRSEQSSLAFTKLYAKRSGIEGTISQGVRSFDLRRSRYIGLVKTHLQHIFTALAINFVRISNFLAGLSPAQTRRSAFVKLLKPLTT
jgi:transposase